MNKHKFLTKTIFVWLIAAVCCFLWGSAFLSIKIGYRLFNISSSDTASIILFAGARFFLAGILTVIIFSFVNKKLLLPTKKSLPKIGVLSLFQTIFQYILFYIALARTTGEKASVIQGTSVFVALLISCLIFKMEKLTLSKFLGSVVGFVGVILVSLDIFTQHQSGVSGELLAFLSTVSYAFSSVFMKRYSKEDNPAMLSGWQFIFGGTVMMIFGTAFGGKISGFTIKSTFLLIYLALISAVAYSLWSILLKYNPVSKVAVCGFMTPVFGYALSSLFASEGQKMGAIGVVALLLVVLGMIIVNCSPSAARSDKNLLQ